MEVTQTIDLLELVEKLRSIECIANVALSFAIACFFGLAFMFLWGLNNGTKKDSHD